MNDAFRSVRCIHHRPGGDQSCEHAAEKQTSHHSRIVRVNRCRYRCRKKLRGMEAEARARATVAVAVALMGAQEPALLLFSLFVWKKLPNAACCYGCYGLRVLC